METVLICMQQMGVGGVETVVLNQIQDLVSKKYKVMVIGTFGIYTEVYKKLGAECIEFDFLIREIYSDETIKKFEDKLDGIKFKWIYVHSSECIPYVLKFAIKNNIPYIPYIHGGTKEIYEWYINKSYSFNEYFKLFFRNAYKSIAITKKSMNNIVNLFNINEEKILIRKNSLNFNQYIADKNINNSKTNVLILSRLSKEKMQSVINSINFFEEYVKTKKNAKLFIAGTGNAEEDIEEYVKSKEIKNKVKFLGNISDIDKEIKKYDIILGMGRCILESIAMKKIAIISGYKSITGIVNSKNIEEASNENFTDRYTDKDEFYGTIKHLVQLTKNDIEQTVNENYEYCYNNLNYEKNAVYCEKLESPVYNELKLYEVIEKIYDIQNYYEEEISKKNKLIEEMYVAKEYLEKQLENNKNI